MSDDVNVYFYLDTNRIVYLADGNLYLYNGKESDRLAKDVDLVWYSGEVMDTVNSDSTT